MIQAMSEVFARPDPAHQRAHRAFQAMTHLTDRHAATPARRHRQAHPEAAAPHELVRLVAGMAGGSIVAESGEAPVDTDDLVAALTLMPGVRADLAAVELQLLEAARRAGMTWQDIAFGLGLNTPQAARQRYERLAAQTAE